MSTIPKKIIKQIETYIRFISDQNQREVAKAAIEFGYQLATDGREELEKENERLKKPDWPTLKYVHELEEENKTLKDTIEQLKLFSQNNRQ